MSDRDGSGAGDPCSPGGQVPDAESTTGGTGAPSGLRTRHVHSPLTADETVEILRVRVLERTQESTRQESLWYQR